MSKSFSPAPAGSLLPRAGCPRHLPHDLADDRHVRPDLPFFAGLHGDGLRPRRVQLLERQLGCGQRGHLYHDFHPLVRRVLAYSHIHSRSFALKHNRRNLRLIVDGFATFIAVSACSLWFQLPACFYFSPMVFLSLPSSSPLPLYLLLQSGMYMLDSEYWDASFSRGLNIFRQILIMVATAGAVIGIVFRVEDYSYGPLCVFLVRGCAAFKIL